MSPHMKKNQEDRNDIEVGKISQKAIMKREEVERMKMILTELSIGSSLYFVPRSGCTMPVKDKSLSGQDGMSREKRTGIRVPYGVKPRVGAGQVGRSREAKQKLRDTKGSRCEGKWRVQGYLAPVRPHSEGGKPR